jgi:hypothetical protein
MRVWVAIAFALGCGALAASAGNGAADDKSQYWLLDPTPDRLLREMTSDRPDITESPFTVDAGRVQMETTLFGYARSRPEPDGSFTDTYELGTTNVRIGVTSNSEVGIVWQPYGVVRTHRVAPLSDFTQSGIGGLELRAKVNLWGNDTFEKPGATAMALLPFVMLPTDRHNGISPEFVESGLIVPLALKLTNKLELDLSGGIAWVRADASTRYHEEYLASAVLSYEWSERLGTYYEIAARLHTLDPRGDVVIVATGVTYKLRKDLQLDAGVNVGITPAADRVNPFIGVSKRF